MAEFVRLGIIGIGNQGSGYARHLTQDGWCPEIKLTAIADKNPARVEWAKNTLPEDVTCFDNAIDMLDSGLIDACVVSIPHYDHPKYVMECMKRGIHVMCEKPAGVYTKQVREMNEEAKKHPEVVFGMMFNQRTDCLYRKMRELVQSGKYGRIRRTNWIITNWFRSEAYYRSGGWRAPWAGEGGGVLFNQCPHNIDLFQWICGMPTAVTAIGGLGKYHDIEVEDDCTALFEYENGATGVFVTTTGEAPGTNRLEIIGDRGKLVNEGGKLTFTRNEIPADVFNKTTPNSFGRPEVWDIDIPVNGNGEQHNGIRKNFVNAILKGEKLIAPAEEGIKSVEMANAMLYSLMTGKRVELPLDAAMYEEHLKKLIANSRFVKKDEVKAGVDMGKSF